MYTNPKLSRAVRMAIALGAVSTTALSTAAFAEDDVERIEVTGSRIKRTDLESASPVTVVTRDDLIQLGITDVGALIQRLPAMSGSPIGTTTNNGGSGAVEVNLRGLGAVRTLVLINGRRTVDGGDFQTIPTAMIKRVEILKDGASAVYGADAVSGVVNIITRDDFEGVQVEIQNKDYFDTDNGRQQTISLIAGSTWDRGNVVFGVEYTDQESVLQGDTDIEFFRDTFVINDADDFAQRGFITPTDDPDNLTVFSLGSGSPPGGNFTVNGLANRQTLDPQFFGNEFPNSGQFRDFIGSGPGNDTYNFAPVNFLQTPYENANAFVETKFEVSENTRFFGAVRLNHRESSQRLAPQPYDTGVSPGFTVDVLDADGNVLGQAQGVSKDNAYNPFGADVTRARRRIVEGNRDFQQDVTQVQAVIGFEGEINDEWSWDASYNWGRRSRTDVNFGQFFGANLAQALGPSFVDDNNSVVCGTEENPIAGCVSLNLFGGPGTITQDMLDFIQAPLVDTTQIEQDMFTAALSGEVFDLPAGPIGVAFGYEYRREALQNEVDSGKFFAAVTGNTGKGTKGSFTVNSLFTEAVVPVLRDQFLAESLDLKFGLRHDDFSTFGTNTTIQGGFEWRPMDGLLVRSTIGEVFRAPNINELFDGLAQSFPQSVDPCNVNNIGSLSSEQQARCFAQGVPAAGNPDTGTQQTTTVGGNTDLQPEEGDTLTFGVAWSPTFLDGFSITVDYWDIDLDNVIRQVGAQTILDLCILNGDDASCSKITRTFDGSVTDILRINENTATFRARGVDYEVNYRFSIGDFGELDTHLGWTHLIERSRQSAAGLPEEQLAGRFDTSDGEAFSKNKATFDVNWYWNDLTTTYAVEYIDSLDSSILIDAASDQHVSTAVYHDLAVAYNFDFGTRVSLGINNAFDRSPPFIDNALNATTDPSTYRVFGREWFLRLSHSF